MQPHAVLWPVTQPLKQHFHLFKNTALKISLPLQARLTAGVVGQQAWLAGVLSRLLSMTMEPFHCSCATSAGWVR